MGRSSRHARSAYRHWSSMVLVLLLLAIVVGPGEMASAEDAPTPQLPILLLNGAINIQDYNQGSLPASFRVDGYPQKTSALYILQCSGPVKETWIEDLRSIGAEPRGYLPYNALVVGMDGEANSRLGELGFVEWSGLYQPYFKISPALQLRYSQGGEVMVLAQLFSARFLADTLDALAELPVEVIGYEADTWCGLIALRMPCEELSAVASLPAVEWIELCTSGSLTGVLQDGFMEPVDSGIAPQAGRGGGDSVGVGDTGLGSGGLQGLPAQLAGSVSALYSLRGDSGADMDGHGTAVAGVILGAGRPSGSARTTTDVNLLEFATGYGLERPPQPLSLYSILDSAYAHGAKIFLSGTVPEGRESLGAYGIYASQRDSFAWNNPYMSLVEAAGNEGTDANADGVVDAGSLLGSAVTKNALSVGGCESAESGVEGGVPMRYSELEEVFSGRFPVSPLRDDSSVGSPPGMAAFSSRGPTRDGRIKPDLVAPSTDIPTLASGGAESAPGLFPAATPGYVRAFGTSMAAAYVAAGLASMLGPLTSSLGTEPSAALLKAFLVNGALDLTPGQFGVDDPEIPAAPNTVEGWGRLDLGPFGKKDSWMKVLDDPEGMRLEELRVFRIEVQSGDELRVTLAWTDYPSLPEARLHLVNDLDLRIIDPDGNEYYPNGRSSRDPLNNVERIVLDVSEKPGDYTVEIYAWNVPFSPQPFALVAQVL